MNWVTKTGPLWSHHWTEVDHTKINQGSLLDWAICALLAGTKCIPILPFMMTSAADLVYALFFLDFWVFLFFQIAGFVCLRTESSEICTRSGWNWKSHCPRYRGRYLKFNSFLYVSLWFRVYYFESSNFTLDVSIFEWQFSTPWKHVWQLNWLNLVLLLFNLRKKQELRQRASL